MPIFLATLSLDPTLVTAGVAIGSLIVGWLLNVISEAMSRRTLFDHRVRLEKEYELYSELWDKLFELRRAVGQMVDSVGTGNVVRDDERALELFNAYQGIVHKSEPFMHETVYGPAREIVTHARGIITNAGKQLALGQRRDGAKPALDEQIATHQVRLDEEDEAAFKKVENLFQRVAKAIRRRVSR